MHGLIYFQFLKRPIQSLSLLSAHKNNLLSANAFAPNQMKLFKISSCDKTEQNKKVVSLCIYSLVYITIHASAISPSG